MLLGSLWPWGLGGVQGAGREEGDVLGRGDAGQADHWFEDQNSGNGDTYLGDIFKGQNFCGVNFLANGSACTAMIG